MQIILTKDVDSLGSNGDIVEVASGYYRNYLEPRHLAVQSTKGSLEDLQRRIDRIRDKAEKKHQEDLVKAGKITELELIILEANAGDGGKLYGTITTKQLSEVISEKTGFPIERRNVNLDRPINRTGDYMVYIKFSPKVSAQVGLQVNAIKNRHEEFALEEAFAGEDLH